MLPEHAEPMTVADRAEADRRRLAEIDEVIAAGPFAATWESLAAYEVPRWYVDGKFGIFIHWGVYSVPAFRGEWYSRMMYREGSPEWQHHRDTYGDQTQFGYKDFIPQLTAERFEPSAWANLFRRAGAQFVVPVAEHHDGFAMYDSDRSRWTAAKMGPQRDVLGELEEAVVAEDLVFGASSHRAEHWFFMNFGMRSPSDVQDAAYADFYGPAQREETQPTEAYLQDWFLRTIEVIDGYRPQILWFDWWIEQPAFEPWLRRLAAYYYNRAHQWGRSVVINYKWTAFQPGTAVYDIERGAVANAQPEFWQNDTSVSRNSWGFSHAHDYKTLDELVVELVDVVAKNGALLLNIGPRPDGTIPEAEQELLLAIGEWLAVNGESVYGTRPWRIAAEGPTKVVEGSFVDGESARYTAQDIRFTSMHHVTGEYIYATALDWPDDGVLRIRALGHGAGLLDADLAEVRVLGHRADVAWTQHWDRLEVTLPAERPSAVGVVVKVFLRPRAPQPRRDFLHQ